jgi:hypothetical protein
MYISGGRMISTTMVLSNMTATNNAAGGHGGALPLVHFPVC